MSTTGTTPEGVKAKGIRAGRNLPAAIGVGAVLGGLALLTLLTVKATFLLFMGAALAIALKARLGGSAEAGAVEEDP